MEFMQVLWEMDIYSDLAMFEAIPVRALRNWDRALETLRHRLFVRAGTAKDEILQHAMRELLIETPDGYLNLSTQSQAVWLEMLGTKALSRFPTP